MAKKVGAWKKSKRDWKKLKIINDLIYQSVSGSKRSNGGMKDENILCHVKIYTNYNLKRENISNSNQNRTVQILWSAQNAKPKTKICCWKWRTEWLLVWGWVWGWGRLPSKTFKYFAVFCAWDAFCPVTGHVQQSVAYVARLFYMDIHPARIYPAKHSTAQHTSFVPFWVAYCLAFMKFCTEFRDGQLEKPEKHIPHIQHPEQKMSRQLIPKRQDEVNKLRLATKQAPCVWLCTHFFSSFNLYVN